eukprot:g2107.t1
MRSGFSRLDESPPQARARLYSPPERDGWVASRSDRSVSCSRCAYFFAGGGAVLAVAAIAVAGVLLGMEGDDATAGGGNRTGTVTGLRVVSAGPSSLEVKWGPAPRIATSAPRTAYDFFELQYYCADDASSFKGATVAQLPDRGMSYKAKISKLNASTAYCFRIRGRSDLGTVGEWSASVCNATTAAAVPGVPPIPIVVDLTSASVEMRTNTSDILHVKIPLPQDNGGHLVTMIRVRVHGIPVASQNITDITENGGDAHISFDVSTRGSLLAVSSVACNDVGCGKASQPTNCIIAEKANPGTTTRGGKLGSSAVALCSACPVGVAGGGGHSPGTNLPAPTDLISTPMQGSTSIILTGGKT